MNKLKNLIFFAPILVLIFAIASTLSSSYKFASNFKRETEVVFMFSQMFDMNEIENLISSIEDWKAAVPNDIVSFNGDSILYEELHPDDLKTLCNQDKSIILINVNKIIHDGLNFVEKITYLNILGLTVFVGQIDNCIIQNVYLNYYEFIETKLNFNKNTVFSHEIGHAIGLSHIEDQNSIMSEFYSQNAFFFTQHDIKEFCKVYSCSKDMKKFTYFHIPE